MKFLHLADLHFGKIVNGFSMCDEQAHIVKEILQIVDRERPDALLLAGDIYDRSIPSETAVRLYDEFLTALSQRAVPVLAISGNHDSAERLSFGERLMESSGIYTYAAFDGRLRRIDFLDEHGALHIYLLPFIKPYGARAFFPASDISTYQDAFCAALNASPIDASARNVLVAHQFVLPQSRSADLSDSEQHQVGGVDCIDAALLYDFDYVALGHLHKAQAMGQPYIRYAGSPLKYSFSEAGESEGQSIQKSVTLVELGAKGDMSIREIPLHPLRDLREIRGCFSDLIAPAFLASQSTEDYLHITLTDEEEIYDAIGKLRVHYPHIMQLDYDNRRSRSVTHLQQPSSVESCGPGELFFDFFQEMNGQPPNELQLSLVENRLQEEGESR